MNQQTLETIVSNFVTELNNAHRGIQNSLAFLTSSLPEKPLLAEDSLFQVLVIGGSVCRNALFRQKNGELIIENEEEKKQPLFITSEDFFSFVEKEIHPKIDTLGLNFAFPLKPATIHGIMDGFLPYATKEHSFAGLVGKQVGKTLALYLQKKLGKKIRVAVANDTICLLLSGLTKFPKETLACGIVGTGFNIAFFLNSTHVVNLESGNFNNFPIPEDVLIIDQESATPGSQLFEKAVSGGYLYKRFNFRARELGFAIDPLPSSKELDILAKEDSPAGNLTRKILEESAALVACQLAAVAIFKDCPLTIVMEGSLFWKGYDYKKTVEKYVSLLSPNHLVTFVHIDNSAVLGGAKLVS